MKNLNLYLTTLFMLLACWLFVGIKVDDEFGDLSVFFKYRPTFQVYFRSPLGMQDMPTDYPTELVLKEAIYDDFVNTKHVADGFFFELLSLLLISGTLVLVGISVFKFLKANK
ncbi:MAG: hypothetical protein EOO96_00445 [Pedobacter sp.]|nr:MAG: hypothetical protein EOO96_00445 [Pedobacter sp.]